MMRNSDIPMMGNSGIGVSDIVNSDIPIIGNSDTGNYGIPIPEITVFQ
jgi:hypothetical protein